MQTDNVFPIRKPGTRFHATECTVDIRFHPDKISYSISGADTELSDRLAIAAALEATANDLRGLAKGLDSFRRK